MYACKFNNIEIIKLLLECENMDVNLQNNEGYSTLMLWTLFIPEHHPIYTSSYTISVQKPYYRIQHDAYNKHADVYMHYVRFLLKYENININLQNNQKYVALMHVYNNEEMVDSLLISDNKEMVNSLLISDNKGGTALIYACKRNNIDMVDILTSCKNIDINLQDNEGHTALYYACENENVVIVKLLLNHESIDMNKLIYVHPTIAKNILITNKDNNLIITDKDKNNTCTIL